MHYLILIISVFISSTAHVLLKAGADKLALSESTDKLSLILSALSSPWVMSGLFCHAIALIVWLYGLSKVDISYAYPFLSIGFVITGLAGWLIFDETINATRLSGMLITLVGIILIAKS